MNAKPKSPPEWVIEIETRLRRLGVTKRQLAQKLNMNYTIVCNASTWYIDRPDVVEKIFAKIEELESRGWRKCSITKP